MPIDVSAVDAIAARFAARGGQPGLAYGIVADGELIHSGGCGERWVYGPVPDADTVFRIASMTKSFTATLLLLLRDRGALRLDDPAVDYVTVLRGLELPTADCPPVTIRHLLTMTAGFPTDDPWGDRQQGLDPATFAWLLASGGLRCAWAPGTRFEYSNLSYAILGKVIEAVTGVDYAQAVRTEVLGPLGLDLTGYDAAEFDPEQLSRGYRRDSGAWLELEPDPHGAFAPMGVIFSCVRDLARWVAGFADAFPARAEGGRDCYHPLRRASRREMQLGQVAITDEGSGTVVTFSGPAFMSYGFGLFTDDYPAHGTVVQHSGGYPGYGSQMRWHPKTGLGAIALANSTYAHAGALAGELLAALLAADARSAAQRGDYRLRGPVPDPGGLWPETIAARDAVDHLLQDWDQAIAGWIFAPNIDMDQPLEQRRADIARLRERIGPFRTDSSRPAESDSPAQCRWWLTGPNGTVAAQIRLAPLSEPLVQQLTVAVPPAAGSGLHRALEALIDTLNSGATDWPAGLVAADGVSADRVLRRLRMAAAWAGRGAIDRYQAGNGDTSTTVRLTGTTGNVVMTVEISESSQELLRAEISLTT